MSEALITRRGGGVQFASGSFTPSADTKTISFDVGFTPANFVIHATKFPSGGNTSASYVETMRCGVIAPSDYTWDEKYIIYSSTGSSYYSRDVSYPTVTCTNGVVAVTTVSTYYARYPVKFKANTKYEWFAWAE